MWQIVLKLCRSWGWILITMVAVWSVDLWGFSWSILLRHCMICVLLLVFVSVCCIYCVSISWFDLGREERIINAMLTTGVFVKDAHCSKDSTTVSRTNHPRPGRIKKCRRRKSVYNCSPTCSSSSSYMHFPSCKCTWHQGLHIPSCCLDTRKDIYI